MSAGKPEMRDTQLSERRLISTPYQTGSQESSECCQSVAPQPDRFTISWRNLTYIVRQGKVDRMIGKLQGQPKIENRIVLNNISGSFSSYEMTALMGEKNDVELRS